MCSLSPAIGLNFQSPPPLIFVSTRALRRPLPACIFRSSFVLSSASPRLLRFNGSLFAFASPLGGKQSRANTLSTRLTVASPNRIAFSPAKTQPATRRQPSKVYPIHAPLFEAWRRVINVHVTSTEEYPALRPARNRKAFVHADVKVSKSVAHPQACVC